MDRLAARLGLPLSPQGMTPVCDDLGRPLGWPSPTTRSRPPPLRALSSLQGRVAQPRCGTHDITSHGPDDDLLAQPHVLCPRLLRHGYISTTASLSEQKRFPFAVHFFCTTLPIAYTNTYTQTTFNPHLSPLDDIMNNNSDNGVTGAAKTVTGILGNTVSGVSNTVGGVVGME